MSVVRKDLELCIGCRTCEKVCPMDVMWYNAEANKSVIAYVEQCISCGQCFLNCPTGSITMQSETVNFGMSTVS